METEVLGEVGAGQDADAVDSLLEGVVEVVDDRDEESLLEKLQHGMAADEARPTRHQDAPFNLPLRPH